MVLRRLRTAAVLALLAVGERHAQGRPESPGPFRATASAAPLKLPRPWPHPLHICRVLLTLYRGACKTPGGLSTRAAACRCRGYNWPNVTCAEE
jgi:hypothetical protein